MTLWTCITIGFCILFFLQLLFILATCAASHKTWDTEIVTGHQRPDQNVAVVAEDFGGDPLPELHASARVSPPKRSRTLRLGSLLTVNNAIL